MTKVIYLDSHSTTPVDPLVLEEMMPYFTKSFGNSSSIDHKEGANAAEAVSRSREKIAQVINTDADNILFTSGATESNNLALKGVMRKNKSKGNHLITCVTEHPSVLDTVRTLEQEGVKVTYLPVDKHGSVNLQDITNAITDETIIVSIMAANNEVGTLVDLEGIGKIAHEHGVLFHTDAAQALGHVPLDVQRMNIDMMSFSAHKIYGPKGVGGLYIRNISPKVKISSIIDGGGQEKNLRSGTLNVPGIVGLAKALEIAHKSMETENLQYNEWTKYMLEKFSEETGELNGHPSKRLSHNLNVKFDGIESKAIINSISSELAISASSACTTRTVEASHVLLAMGRTENEAHSSIRLGCGRFNTTEEITTATNIIIDNIHILNQIRS